MVIDKAASLPLKDLRIHSAHASFFLLPSGGVKREEQNKTRDETKTNEHTTLIYSDINDSIVYSQVFYLQARALDTRSA